MQGGTYPLKVWIDGRKFHVAIDAIKAINIMKNGSGMDGAFSKSPRPVRETVQPDGPPPQQEPPAQRTGGLWRPRPG